MAPFSEFGGWIDRLTTDISSTTAGSKTTLPFIRSFTNASKPEPTFAHQKGREDANETSSPRTGFPRLSKSVHLMQTEYDVVVIGSGYGGGVAASRLSRAGKSVAVLEMGKEKWPGEYPNTLAEVLPEFNVSGNDGKGKTLKSVATGGSTAMYNLILGEGQNTFVGKGLGGTSLINANVFLECDKRTLALDAWPSELRGDPSALNAYYERAREMLQPTPYPDHLPEPNKLSVLEKQADAMKMKHNFYRVPQTTFFHGSLNHAGVEMRASTGSGQDCTGVNDGSKNSVLVTYIADAWNWGAEIFCGCEAHHVSRDPSGNGYIVYFAWHEAGREKFGDAFKTHLMWVRARELCFLAAGSLGTTEILLRSRDRGLNMSSAIGQKMSGNGDILSFAYNSNEIVNGIGRANPGAGQGSGPTITGTIDNRDIRSSPNVLDGYVMQEGAIPEAFAPLIQSLLELMPGEQESRTWNAQEQLHRLLSRAEARFLGPYSEGGSVKRTQTYLIMSHDSNEAVMRLENDKPHLQFRGVGRTEHVKKLNAVLAEATRAIGGTLIHSPFHAASDEKYQITVHPLGGAVMSSDGTGNRGATNHIGQIFSGEGSEVYAGLVCVDAAVIPTSLGKASFLSPILYAFADESGVNPLATITALAERSVDLILQRRGLSVDWTRNGRLNLLGQPFVAPSIAPSLADAQKILQLAIAEGGVQFTEIVDGHIQVGGNISNFAIAEEVAKASSSPGLLYLSVSAPGPKKGIQSSHREAVAAGTLSCRALSPDPLLAKGSVEFFSMNEAISEGSNLVYNLTLSSTDGVTYHMQGKKDLTTDMSFSITSTWKATTTLRTTITHTDGSLAGRGILRVSWRNFTSELKTLSAMPTGTLLDRASSATDFIGSFAQNAASFYIGPLGTLRPPQTRPPTFKEPYAKAPPSSTIQITAADGVTTTLRTWAPARRTADAHPKPPVLMIPGASVSHAIFALPTVATNAVEYFTARGHGVSVLSHRFSATPVCAAGGTAHEARLDVLAALQHLRGVGADRSGKGVYVVAHCMGAVATAIGLLDGSIPAAWLAGLTCTQVLAHLVFGKWNALKAGNPCLPAAYAAVAGSQWFPMSAEGGESGRDGGRKEGGGAGTTVQRLMDQALRFYPVERRAEVCRSPVCHRFSLTYGRCWEHANLNRATHERLDELLGGVHMRMLKQTMGMGRVGRVLDGEGRDVLVNKDGLERLRGLSILFVSGGENVVFDPESTFITYDLLRRRFGPDLYSRKVIQGYGHLDTWMGKDSATDVFPVVAEHIDLCNSRYF